MIDIKPKAILFDWDNTLVNTWPLIEIATAKMFTIMGRDVNEINRHNPDNHLAAKDILPKIFGDDWHKAYKVYQEEYAKNQFTSLNLFPKVFETLEFLSKHNIYLAIVSNKNGDMLRKEVAHLNLNKYFTKIVGSSDAKADKPSKEAILKSLEDSHIQANKQVWFVGDSEIDMQCALNADCTPILISNEININQNKHNVNIITNFDHFLSRLSPFFAKTL
jgi:phosphoglycolate phosphatase